MVGLRENLPNKYRLMADQSSQNGSQNYEANVKTNSGVVVLGADNTIYNINHITNGHSSPVPHSPCCPSLLESGSEPEFSVEDGLNIVNKVSKFIQKDYLNNYAKVNRNPMKQQQTPLEQVFLEPNLELIDCCCETVRNCSMYDVFEANNANQSPTRALLYGQAFIGKSTLCQKFVYDWSSTSRPGFPSFKVVVLLKLRDAKGTLEECLEREVFCGRLDKNEKAKFFSYMKKRPEEFLFLLDGVDECNLEELPDIKNFLFDKVYRGVYLIATVRLELNDKWLEMSKAFHGRYHITGYGKDIVDKFVSSYFRHDPTKREKLSEFFESNSDMKELPWVPLVTLVMCEYWDEQKDNVLTMTKLLRRYIDVVLEFFKKFKSVGEEIRLEDVFSSHQSLALFGMTEERTEFTKDTLTNLEVNPKVGFLYADFKCKSYKFAHEKLQQYFAAREKVENWDIEKLKSCLSTVPACVLIFIAGLLAEKKDDRLLQFLKMLTISMSETFFKDSCYCNTMDLFLACVAEAWNEQTCEAILGLCKDFEPFRGTKTRSGYPLHMSHGAALGLGLIVRKLHVSKLNLSAIIISLPEAKIIASECLEGNSMLKSVKFSHSCLRSEAVKAVSAAFAGMLRLEDIDLSCCQLGDEGLYAIADLIKHGNCGITSLQLAHVLDVKAPKKEQVQSARHKLTKQDSLKRLKNFSKFQEACNRQPSEQAVKALIEAIQEEGSEIKDLSLPACVVGNAINAWLDVFRINSQLQRIKLHLTDLGELNETVRNSLIELVKDMPDLEQMSIEVQDDKSHRWDYANHHALAEKTKNKIKLTVFDHTHSFKVFTNALAK